MRHEAFCAAHSSSALAANAFGRSWRNDPRTLSVAGLSGLHQPSVRVRVQRWREQARRRTWTPLHGTPDAVLAIESRMHRVLTRGEIVAEAYERIHDVRRDSPWFALVTDAALRSHFAHLDTAQLVKHYLGLAHLFAIGRVVLLYLFGSR